MWKPMRGAVLENHKSYYVRMVIGVNPDKTDRYGAFWALWNSGHKVFVVLNTCDLYEKIDMDDIWVDETTPEEGE